MSEETEHEHKKWTPETSLVNARCKTQDAPACYGLSNSQNHTDLHTTGYFGSRSPSSSSGKIDAPSAVKSASVVTPLLKSSSLASAPSA